MENIKDFVIEYIQREYTIPEDKDIMSLNYVEEGYIDSLGLIQFIAVIEDEFGITFTDEDLKGEDIKVVGKVVELVKRKMEVDAK
nr:acyl carrier protein [uncultured Butyrivibrio sp.]